MVEYVLRPHIFPQSLQHPWVQCIKVTNHVTDRRFWQLLTPKEVSGTASFHLEWSIPQPQSPRNYEVTRQIRDLDFLEIWT